MHKLFFSNLIPKTLLFGRFELIRCLSAGHLAGVYLCSDTKFHNKKIVLKIVSKSVPHLGVDIVRLEQEMKLSQSVKHPNVISGEEEFSDDEFAAFSLEYMDGGTIGDLLE